jgi:hypothetical protein
MPSEQREEEVSYIFCPINFIVPPEFKPSIGTACQNLRMKEAAFPPSLKLI